MDVLEGSRRGISGAAGSLEGGSTEAAARAGQKGSSVLVPGWVQPHPSSLEHLMLKREPWRSLSWESGWFARRWRPWGSGG